MMFVRALGLAAVASAALVSASMAQTPAPASPAQAPAPAAAGDSAAGEGLFKGRCAGCHETGAGGAPDKSTLAMKMPGEIFDALKTGPMVGMASGLSDDDMHNIAAYLTAPAKPAA
jgi:mono/diheme cytochrome c family protein